MFIKPGTCARRGVQLKVRDPRTKRLLPCEGQEVPDSAPFWIRRLRDGDVVLASPSAPAVAPTPVTPLAPANAEQGGQ